MYFSDGSYAFVSNGTYHGADGSFVDYWKGQYTLANDTSGTFAPVTDSSTASSLPSSSSGSQTSPTSPTPSANAKSADMRVRLRGREDIKFTFMLDGSRYRSRVSWCSSWVLNLLRVLLLS